MNDSDLRLRYGASQYVMPGLRAAWGARLIVTQYGDVDLLHDRQDVAGDADRLIEWLNGGALKAAREALADSLRAYRVWTNKPAPVIVYEDERGCFVGNSNGSCGYFYISAWLFQDAPDGDGRSLIRTAQEA